jgi:hypothetical protein
MSLLLNCHYYKAVLAGDSIPTSTNRIWALSFYKCPSDESNGTVTYRGMVQLTGTPIDGTQDTFGLILDGTNAPQAAIRTGNVYDPTTNTFYGYLTANQNRWNVACAVLDLQATEADGYVIYGRSEATAVPVTTSTKTVDKSAFTQTLTELYIGRLALKLTSSAVNTDATSAIKLAEVVIGIGNIPSEAQIQAMLNAGSSPAGLPGAWEHWRFRNSGDGLVGRIRGITLVPTGGSATASYDAADNPTVSDPISVPILSSPTATPTGPTQATIGVTSDTAGTIYSLILPAATAAPVDAATLIANGSAVSRTISATGTPQTFAVTGLTTNTAIKVHWAMTGSNVVSSASFTPNTLAISGTALSAQSGISGSALVWAGATPNSLITNTGNGSGIWTVTAGVGASGITGCNSTTGVPIAATLGTAGSYTITLTYTDSSTVPGAQTITKTFGLTISASGSTSVTTDPLANLSGSLQLNETVYYSWFPTGRLGSLTGITPIEGTTTTSSSTGTATIIGLPAGSGVLLLCIRGANGALDLVSYQSLTAS